MEVSIFSCYRFKYQYILVGRGLGTSLSPSLDTPPSSPSINRVEINSNGQLTNSDHDQSQRKISLSSSQSRTSSDDDSRHSNSQMNSVTYIGGVTTRQTMSTTQRPPSASLTNGSAFKMMSISGNICPRCSKTVYSAEEVKAAGKVFKKKSTYRISFHYFVCSSHFINDVILVLIVKIVSMLLDIQNMKENFMIIVRLSFFFFELFVIV